MTWQIGVVLFSMVLFMVLILTNKVKVHVAAIAIPIILELTGILTTSQAWAGFANNSVIMMASMFVVGAGLSKTDILSRLSKTIIKPGASDTAILIGMFIPTLLLVHVVNATATMTIMLPLIMGICAEQGRPASKFIYPVTILGVLWTGFFPIGSGAGNYLASNAIIEELGGVGTYTYFTNFISKIPFVIILTIALVVFGPKMAPDLTPLLNADQKGGAGTKASTLSPGKQKIAFGVFAATTIGIIVCAVVKVNTWYPALIGAFIMVLSGVVSDREAMHAMSSPVIFIFVGTLPLSTALNSTGGDKLISDAFNAIFGNASPWVIMMAMYILCAVLTQFMSNAAVGTAFRTLAALIAVQGGYDPRAMMLAAAMGSTNCFLLPTAGAVTLLANEYAGYSVKQYMKQGLLITVLHTVIFAIYIPIVFPLK